MISINPATGEPLYDIEALSEAEILRRIQKAETAFLGYKNENFIARAEKLGKFADLMEASKNNLASQITRQMGKPIKYAVAEVEKSVHAVRYYASHGARYLEPEAIDSSAIGVGMAYKTYQPLGPILAVMPWNFPIWQVIRFAAPALMAGNVCLLKHAENVWQTALSLEELFLEAGFPAGCFQALNVDVDKVKEIIASDIIAGVTLTGSTYAGKEVSKNAAERLLPTVLELGGSDPFIVLPDADLENAASSAVFSRFANSGQSCIAAKRFILHRDIKDDFLRLFLTKVNSLRIGDPLLAETDMGPVVSKKALNKLEQMTKDALAKGARLLCGGKRIDKDGFSDGFFFEPTVLDEVDSSMEVYFEEVFGPIACVFEVSGEEEAVLLANDTKYGLGASIWTKDSDKALLLQSLLDCGMVAVNKEVASYPELPFGGIKSSGHGRELSVEGIKSFCNCKTVVVA